VLALGHCTGDEPTGPCSHARTPSDSDAAVVVATANTGLQKKPLGQE
jgi:hypothetical protein